MMLRFLLCLSCTALSLGFLTPHPLRPARAGSQLQLVPISNFPEINFLSEPESYRICIDNEGYYKDDKGHTYQLGLAEEDDLPDTSRFIINSFGAEAIRMSQDLSTFEQLIMKPAVDIVNGYSAVIAFAEVLMGLRSRLAARLSKMDLSPPNLVGHTRVEKLDIASTTSVVLILAKDQLGSDWHVDVIGSVELRLEPCDAKIPFTLPWLDRMERRLASFVGLGKNAARDLQPYLSNLCVDEEYQGRGIGRALVRCVESIARYWGYSRIYLHVDAGNKAAFNLYKSEGYRDVGRRWKPFWAGKAAEIGYFVKDLKISARNYINQDSACLQEGEKSL